MNNTLCLVLRKWITRLYIVTVDKKGKSYGFLLIDGANLSIDLEYSEKFSTDSLENSDTLLAIWCQMEKKSSIRITRATWIVRGRCWQDKEPLGRMFSRMICIQSVARPYLQAGNIFRSLLRNRLRSRRPRLPCVWISTLSGARNFAIEIFNYRASLKWAD